MHRVPPRLPPGPLRRQDADALTEAIAYLYSRVGGFSATPPLRSTEDFNGLNVALDPIALVATLSNNGGLCLSETNGPPTDDPNLGCALRIDPSTFIFYVFSPTAGWIGFCPCAPPFGSGSGLHSGTSGAGAGVLVACCPNLVSITLCVTVVAGGGAPAGLGGTWVFTYSPTYALWFVTIPTPSWCPSQDFRMVLCCTTDSDGESTWVFNLQCAAPGGLPAPTCTGGVQAGVSVCDPLFLHFTYPVPAAGLPNCSCLGITGSYDITTTACAGGGGGGGGGGGNVATNCCPSNGIPTTLTLVVTDAGSCSCLAGTYTLTWQSGSAWSAPFQTLCGQSGTWTFACIGGGPNWTLSFGTAFSTSGAAQSCSPFSWSVNGASGGTACAGTVNVKITP